MSELVAYKNDAEEEITQYIKFEEQIKAIEALADIVDHLETRINQLKQKAK